MRTIAWVPRIHGVERRATPDLNRHETRGHVGNRAARDDEACTNSATGLDGYQMLWWWTGGCVSSPHSGQMSQDIVDTTMFGGGGCLLSLAPSSTQSPWRAKARPSWPVSTPYPGAGSISSWDDSRRADTQP